MIKKKLEKSRNELLNEIKQLKKRVKELENNQPKLTPINSSSLYYDLFEKNLAVKLIIDPDTGNIIDANTSACHFYGYSRSEILQKNITDINKLSQEEVHQEMSRAKLESRNYFIFEHQIANGDIRNVEVFSSPVYIEDKTFLFSIVNDITARKQAEKNLKKAYQELENQKKLLEQLLEATPDHLIMYDYLGRHIYVNKAALDAQGLTEESVIGKTWKDLGFPENAGKSFEEKLKQVFSTGQPIFFEDKFPTIEGLKDWDVFYTPFFNPEGKVIFMVATYRDVTKRKQSEEQLRQSLEEKEVLIKEVHHRVKNNLQIISSLLYLQSRYVKEQKMLEIFRDCQNRIRAMSLVHETLYRSDNLSKIDFSDYLKILINNIFYTYGAFSRGIEINLEMEPVTVSLNTVIYCGLIINELISNSLKYAFTGFEGSQKIIVLELKVIESGKLQLTIADNGVGFNLLPNPQNNELSSLGLQLVNTLVEQMEGEMHFENLSGSKFVFTFSDSST